MEQSVLGIDLGTSGVKTVLFDGRGNRLASAVQEYRMEYPQNGWAEENPEDWWQAAVSTIQSVLAKSGVRRIAAIGLSGQMHSLVMLDKDGHVLRPAILWCDGRNGRECAELTQRVGRARLLEITANPALTGFTAGKILWVRRHEPQVYERCRHILLPKDYIRFRLTGELATDVSDASGTNLLDVKTRRWSREILDALDIDPDWMPDLFESCQVSGVVSRSAAEATGLTPGTVVVGGAADNAASAVGTGTVFPDTASITLGTSGVILAHVETPQTDAGGRVHTFCAAVPGAWLALSCTLAAGLSLRWFRDRFCGEEAAQAREMGIDPYVLLSQAAENVPLGADGLLFLPYLMGERSPLLDEKCRGAFVGLTASHTKGHLLRAVMEGVAYSQRSCLEVLREMGINPPEMNVCGGGGRSALWRQMLADNFKIPVTALPDGEGPALGAALLASVGGGIYPDVRTACGVLRQDGVRQEPSAERGLKYDRLYPIYQSLYTDLRRDFEALYQI